MAGWSIAVVLAAALVATVWVNGELLGERISADRISAAERADRLLCASNLARAQERLRHKDIRR